MINLKILVLLLLLSAPLLAESATQAIKVASTNNDQLNVINNQLSLISEKSVPAIVHISVIKNVQYKRAPHPYEFFFGPNSPYGSSQQPGQIQEKQERGSGSGFLINDDGYILTNYHVVGESEQIKVLLHDGRELTAKLIGSDAKTDVALIKIEGSKHPYLEFSKLNKTQIGQFAVALGFPFDIGVTMTLGVVSATGRDNVGVASYEDFIQTDAAINPGNSGGPLLNLYGEVIGMNTAILSKTGGSMGIGFAIPVSMLENITLQLIEKGRVHRSYMGVSIQDLTPTLKEAFKLKNDTVGVLVSNVMENSPAEKAGLKSGDIILTFDNAPIDSAKALRNLVALKPANKKYEVRYVRKNREKKLMIDLISSDARQANLMEEKLLTDKENILGSFRLSALTTEIRQEYRIPNTITGVIITSVEVNSKGESLGFKPGDIIQSINNDDVETPEKVQSLIQTSRPPYAFLINRNGMNYFVIVEE